MKKRRRNGGGGDNQEALKTGPGVSQFCLMELPTTVLHEIFFRLPVKSIMKLKFVSRAFYKLLSDPDFSVNYTKKSPFATLLAIRNRNTATSKYPVLFLLEISENYKCIRTRLKPKLPGWSKRNSRLSLADTCNGLLCLSLRKSGAEMVYVCNPIVGKCLALPEHKTKDSEEFFLVYGFGFCQSTNNYKILRIVYDLEGDGRPVEGQGEIFTVGVDDGWRSLANPIIPVPFYLSNLVAHNGAFYWLVEEEGDYTWICTFDLGEEKLGQISQPRGLVLNKYSMDLTSFNNQLCLVDWSIRSVIVLWKRKDHAVTNSWTKDIILEISFPSELEFKGLVPVTILQNGDILFSHPSEVCLISYNPITRKCREIQVSNCRRIAYAPSFLSLKAVLMGEYWSTMNV